MTLLSQKQIIQKILRSDFDQEPTTHTQAQEETAQAIKQRARQNTSGLS